MIHDPEDSGESSDFDDVLCQPTAEMEIAREEPPTASSSDREDSPSDGVEDPAILSARAYQLEMLDASLKENIICAMDTGSGKTQVYLSTQIEDRESACSDIWQCNPPHQSRTRKNDRRSGRHASRHHIVLDNSTTDK